MHQALETLIRGLAVNAGSVQWGDSEKVSSCIPWSLDMLDSLFTVSVFCSGSGFGWLLPTIKWEKIMLKKISLADC